VACYIRTAINAQFFTGFDEIWEYHKNNVRETCRQILSNETSLIENINRKENESVANVFYGKRFEVFIKPLG
jgi:hypothetical protein